MSRINLKNKILLAFKNPNYILKYLKNRLRKSVLLDYRFLNGYSFSPFFLNWEITVRCNLNCEMCWLKNKEIVSPKYFKDELSLKEVKNIIDDISQIKPIINFGGGEPFIRDDMEEILKYAEKKSLITSVITNGTLLSGKEREILETGVDSITFSLDGTEQMHDNIRGKGNFKKTTKVIKEMVKERNGKTPIIKINSVITSSNYKKLSEFYEIVKSLNVDYLRFQHLWFVDEKDAELHKNSMENLFGLECKGINGYVSNPSFSLNKLWKEIEKVKNKSKIPIGFYPDLGKKDLKKYYKKPRKVIKNRCLYPWFNAHIKPNGDLLSCFGYLLPYKYGNLKEKKFTELWNGEEAKRFRRIIKKRGIFSGCKRCCGLFEH